MARVSEDLDSTAIARNFLEELIGSGTKTDRDSDASTNLLDR